MREKGSEVLDMPVPRGLMEQRGVPDELWRRVPEEKLPPTCHG